MSDRLNVASLQERLLYDPETGVLTWKHNPNARREWNTRRQGKVAGCIVETNIQKHAYRYVRLSVDKVPLRAHRVAWALYYGAWPEDEIDHINGDPTDNRILNLRAVSRRENARNQQLRTNNTSGFIGVTWDKVTRSWAAGIVVDGRYKRLGRFKDKLDAVRARQAAERHYAFHENHGRQIGEIIAPLFPVSWAALVAAPAAVE